MNERPLKNEHVSGKRFVLIIGIIFVVMAIGLGVGIRAFVHHIDASKPPAIALRWQDRDLWPMSAMRPFELEYSRMVQAETGKRYRKAEFSLAQDPAQEQRIETALLTCAALARDQDHFADAATRTQLEAQLDVIPDQFYPPYLLAAWHAMHGQMAEADRWMAKAVALAPAMLMEDEHAPNQSTPSLAIAFDRLQSAAKENPSFWERAAHHTKDQMLDTNLVLVYPTPMADAKGRVWLPVFRDMYRWAPPALAQPHPDTNWFSMSDGVRVGHLNAAGSQIPPKP